MSDTAPRIPEPPDTPDWFKTLRWIPHYFVREGEVIWKAPVATLIVWAILGYLASWYWGSRYEEQIKNLSTAITALQSNNDNQKGRIEAYIEKIVEYERKLEGKQPQPPSAQPSPILAKRLADQTDQQIRDGLTLFTKELRAFEAAFRIEDSRLSNLEWIEMTRTPGGDEASKNKKWGENTAKMLARREGFSAEFDTRFRSGALAYKEEICKRLQFRSPCPLGRHNALDSGLLAGPRPVMEVADYLDEIARKLPD